MPFKDSVKKTSRAAATAGVQKVNEKGQALKKKGQQGLAKMMMLKDSMQSKASASLKLKASSSRQHLRNGELKPHLALCPPASQLLQ